MCFGAGSSSDNAAAQARAEEAARQARVSAGTARVGEVFGQFDEPYYKNVSDTALNYYKPEVDRQFTDAQRNLTFNLSRSGNLQSTAGADQRRRLQDAKARTDVDIANKAQGHATDARAKIEGQRSDVMNSLFATADPDSAMSSATNAASLAAAPQTFSPIGDLFSGLVATGANAIAAERAGYRGFGTGLFASSSPKGSARNVNA